MILQLDADDITALIRQGVNGRDLVKVHSIDEDEIVLQMIFPRQLTVTLQHFILHSNSLTAEMSPWWVRGLVGLYLKWRGDDRAKIEGNRIDIRFPQQMVDRLLLHDFSVHEERVSVDFLLREEA